MKIIHICKPMSRVRLQPPHSFSTPTSTSTFVQTNYILTQDELSVLRNVTEKKIQDRIENSINSNDKKLLSNLPGVSNYEPWIRQAIRVIYAIKY
jgi:hypothetical protein